MSSAVQTTLQITGYQLRSLAPYLDGTVAAQYAEALEAAREEGDLSTPTRIAMFMAECAEETNGFRRLEESLSYTNPQHLLAVFPKEVGNILDAEALVEKGAEAIGNRVYANRYGNGDEASGDGFRYRGRGFIQLTFKDNYKVVGDAVKMAIVTHPDLLSQPGPAAQVAASFWKSRGCNACADRNDFIGVTKLINPSLQGLADRQAWLNKTARIWA